MQRMLGDDFARSMNIPLADIVYLQQRPVPLLPRRLRRRRRAAKMPRTGPGDRRR